MFVHRQDTANTLLAQACIVCKYYGYSFISHSFTPPCLDRLPGVPCQSVPVLEVGHGRHVGVAQRFHPGEAGVP